VDRGHDVKRPVATCPICELVIWMEVPDTSARADPGALQQELDALADEHLRSHPAPVQALFWLRRFLGDVPPGERAAAVRRIYTDLRALWGEYDSRGMYSIDEALGTAGAYRLWLDAHRCSYTPCRHAENVLHPPSRAIESRTLTWHDRILGSILPPPQWHGTSREWRQLAEAVNRNCACPSTQARSGTCPAHRLLADSQLSNRLLFGRRMAVRLQRGEFADCLARPSLLAA
jgi:hypothetical protein